MNRKFLLSLLIMFIFSAVFVYADKNFVTVLSGSDTAISSSAKSSAFVGQTVSYDTEESLDYISRSSFASIIRTAQSGNITFTNNTGTNIFTDINVPLNVDIVSSGENIVRVKYQIWQGSTPNWDSLTDEETHVYYNDATGVPYLNFSETVSFSSGKTENYFRVYVQLGNNERSWSADYLVRLSSDLSDVITITAPDRLTKLATLDPTIETTPYSISLTTATVSLYEGNFASGTPMFKLELSETSNATYKMYDKDKGKMSFVYSDFIKIYNSEQGTSVPVVLTNNKTYTLKLVTKDHEDEPDTLTFKALGGGVADILTYPSPFNPKKEKIKIRYLLAKDANVTIKIYDKAGKIVSKLIQSEPRTAGTNEDEWDGRSYSGDTLATGAYICEITAKSSSGEDRRYTAFALVGK